MPNDRPVALYIEDDLANRALLRAALERVAGFSVINIEEGKEGIDAVRVFKPDVILVDLNLGRMTGEEVIAALKLDPDTKHIPVIALTGDMSPRRRQILLAMGVADYIVKPFDLTDLTMRVKRTLLQR